MSKQLKNKKLKQKNKKGKKITETQPIIKEQKAVQLQFDDAELNLQKENNIEKNITKSPKKVKHQPVQEPELVENTISSSKIKEDKQKNIKKASINQKDDKKDNKNITEHSTSKKVPKSQNNKKTASEAIVKTKKSSKAKNDVIVNSKNKIDKEQPIVKAKVKNQKNISNKQEKKEETILNTATKKEFIKDNILLNIFFVTIITFSVEMIFKAINDFSIISYSSLRILISDLLLALIVTFISSSTKHRWLRTTINLLYIIIYSIYAWLQIGFMNFLGVYISFNTSSQAGAVVDYIQDFLSSFKPIYYVIFAPILVSILFYIIIRKKEYHKLKWNFKTLLIVPLLASLCYCYYLTLTVSFMQSTYQVQSNLKLFLNPNVPTIAVNQFGTSIFSLTDLRTYLYPPADDYTYDLSFQDEQKENVSREVPTLLNDLAKTEENSKYNILNKYFASQKITDFNDHTGMFEGMNVVVVFLESGSYALVNEKYYPNFYKLYSEGWHWNNYYSPRNSCATGNNEFSALTGLYSIYNTCTTNTYKNNTYFQSIFGIFNEADYRTTSMHNFTEWYYYRKTSHKNMGSTYYGADALDIATSVYGEWPSDIELMEKAFNIILNDEDSSPWMTWLTTVTSHQPYSRSSTLGDLHVDYFESEGYSTTVSRYLSKLKVLDDAIGYMIKTLEEAGELDNTLIVMMPDHYPYGLKEERINEMYNTSFDDYENEKVPLVMYNPQMENTAYETYTSYVDLVPTIANLLNIDYDPRLYMGTDLFSDSHESLVIFADGSWKNEFAYYDASKSKLTEYQANHYTVEDIQRITNMAANKTSISTLAVKNNYFDYLYKKMQENGTANSKTFPSNSDTKENPNDKINEKDQNNYS